MNFKLVCLAAVIMIISAAKISAQERKAIAGQYIIILKESYAQPVIKQQKMNNDREKQAAENKELRDKNLAKLRAVYSKCNVRSDEILNEFCDVLVGFAAKLSDKELSALKENQDVAGVSQDYEVALPVQRPEANPADVGGILNNELPDHRDLKNDLNSGPFNDIEKKVDNTFIRHDNPPSQFVSCSIIKAGGFVDGSSKNTWIWILDTGVSQHHPDLNVATNTTFAKRFTTGESIFDFINDKNGHGTRVAGIAAAKNNAIGVVGVSAGAKVVPVQVLNNSGIGTWSAIISGLNHVSMYGMANDVVCLSVGGEFNPSWGNCESMNPPVRDAIRNLGIEGIWVCLPAGISVQSKAENFFPGCLNGSKIITVGSIECMDMCSSWSNFSSNVVDWVTVGSNVYTTDSRNPGYATFSGTDMAMAVVAGIVHARAGAPASGGHRTCKGVVCQIATR